MFLFQFDNDREAIVRLPLPVAGPPKIVTSSEVATMTFAREVLDIPVPRVFGWCADAAHTEVGAAYIIMENIRGTTLRARWPRITEDGQTAPLLQQFLAFENALQSVSFSQYGSLYFREDVSPELRDKPLFHESLEPLSDKLRAAASRFRIGPIAGHHWWRNSRVHVPASRGPCKYNTSHKAAP